MDHQRFMLDNDGDNLFRHISDEVERDIAETVQECPANVTTYLLCSAAGTCYWPTRQGIVVPYPNMLAAHARGLDPFGLLLRGLKAAGKETFITYRMNDVHNPDAADQWNTPRLRREHPECVVGYDEIQRGTTEWMSYCLDYSRPEVREYVLALIREQITLYGDTIDGFQLDWMRFPRHLSGNAEEVHEKRNYITDFMAEVRAVLAEANHKILLSARVPSTPAGCRYLGFDLAAWGRRGLIDLLVTSPFLTSDWQLPIAEFRALLGTASLPIYAGFDFEYGQRQPHTAESLRGLCSSLYDCRPDGIYVFNFPCWVEYLAARPYHWLAGLEAPATAAAKPLLLAVDTGRNRLPGIDREAPLPLTLGVDAAVELTLHVPEAALPAWRATLLVHSGGDLTVEVNARRAVELRKADAGAIRPELFLQYDSDYCPRPAETDCRGFRLDPSTLHPGENTIRLANRAGSELRFEFVHLGLW